MSKIREELIKLGYVVYGFGEGRSEVIVHYRRGGEDEGLRIYGFSVVDDRCPYCGWRVSTAYVLASSRVRPRIWWRMVYGSAESVWLIC